jgi:uncharacterized membrane protein YkoI
MNSARIRIPFIGALVAAVAGLALVLGAESDAAASGSAADARKAIATARAATGGAPAYDIESERRRGASVWEVKVATGGGTAVEVDVSADGRRVVHRHSLAKRDSEARLVGSAKVSLAAAVRIADAHATGPLDEAELDREHGKLVWSVSFGSGAAEVEVEVDAASGAVLGTDRD